MIPGNANPLLLKTAAAAAAGDTGRSLRFNSGDSAYLTRTPSSAGNRRTFTFAAWVKRSKLGANQVLMEASPGSGAQYTLIWIASDDKLGVVQDEGSGGVFFPYTDAVFRDTSAWMHVCIAMDTTQSTAADRLKIYINGVEQSYSSVKPNPPQNNQTYINSTNAHDIGRRALNSTSYLDGYMTDIYLIDGSALSPVNNFIELDDNGVYQAKNYSGTFGTNGFHLLDFANESTVGHDSSGNENDFTANNISTSAGAGNDVLFDFPANGTATDSGAGGEVSGNYATLNPLNMHTSNNSLPNGALEFTTSGNDGGLNESTIAMSSGKFYFEVVYSRSGQGQFAGIRKPGSRNYDNSFIYVGTGLKYTNGGSGASYGATLAHGDVIGTAFDATNGTLEFFKNGTSQGTAFTGISGTYSFFVGSFGGAPTGIVNFGQRPFTHAAPSGFTSLNTASLPTPTIADGSDYFDIQLYTGNGASTPGGSGSTQDFSNFAFAPSWVWIKDRTQSGHNHNLVDIVRGAPNLLLSDANNAEITNSTDGFTGFTSDGFTLGDNGEGTQSLELNKNGNSYVAWAWNGGSSTASNTDGSITSSVRANQSAGFSIVTYSGNSTSGATVGHGLSVAPAFWMFKARNSSDAWIVRHTSIANTHYLVLNSTQAAANPISDVTGDTDPTSSVIPIGDSDTNNSGTNYVVYIFAPVEGYSAFGTYTGNGASGYPNADGPFVYLGFRPAWILWKCTSQTENWTIYDTARGPFNYIDNKLLANSSAAESTNANHEIDFLSNGFKVRNNNGEFNQNNGTYVYAAFAENPFQANGGLAR